MGVVVLPAHPVKFFGLPIVVAIVGGLNKLFQHLKKLIRILGMLNHFEHHR